MRPWVLFAVLLLAPGAASAQPRAPSVQQVAHWTILPFGLRCLAINRPMGDFNASPWNALAFDAPRGGGLSLHVHYWPGYLDGVTPGAMDIAIEGPSALRTKLAARPAPTPGAVETAPLPPEVAEALRNATRLSVTFGPQSLSFDLAPMGEMLAALERCRQAPR